MTGSVSRSHGRAATADPDTREAADYDYAEDYEDFDAYAEYEQDDGVEDYDLYQEPDDRRWLWVASVAGIVLLIAVAGTLMILSGGDSGTTTATVSPSTSEAAPYPSEAPKPSASRAPSATALPPETITSVTPTPTPSAAAPTTSAEPTEAAPPPAAEGRTVTYTVTGNRQLFDLITIIYTDGRGALQTDVNVALPWTKQITLDPGVTLTSVTATSVAGQLNCAITDGSGETLAVQNNNTMIANCTR
ncbi:hypothetical protein MAGR_30890 [Mycolicibacterium agri]|nr:hypothetical protein MAGR_30890 [Mycolicibacterium agri]